MSLSGHFIRQLTYFIPDQTKVVGNLCKKNSLSTETESSKLLWTVNQGSSLTSWASQELSQMCNRMKASAGIKPTDLGVVQMLRALQMLFQGTVAEWWTKAALGIRKSRVEKPLFQHPRLLLHPRVAVPLPQSSLEPGKGTAGIPSAWKDNWIQVSQTLVNCSNCKVVAHNSTTSCLQGSWQWYFCENNPACVLSTAMAAGQEHFALDPSWSQVSSTTRGSICARAGAALGLCKHSGPAILKPGTEEVLLSSKNPHTLTVQVLCWVWLQVVHNEATLIRGKKHDSTSPGAIV